MSIIAAGFKGDYRWITSKIEMSAVMRLCPSIFLGRYVAVTSADSGQLHLGKEEIANGWESRGGIGYSPCISSIDVLPLAYLEAGSFHEWFIFKLPPDLGQLSHRNVFAEPLHEGIVVPFVNYLSFKLHDENARDLHELFWEQLQRLKPESYLSDSESFLTFISCRDELFSAVYSAVAQSQE